ncbi:MAG: chorismate lyase [Reinekea sp.]|nr:chorismate lyase [Reinekea sp.]
MTRLIQDPDTRLHRWHPIAQIRSTIPDAYRPWIHLPGSLTKALRERSDQFSVEVLAQEHIIVSLPIDGLEHRAGARGYFSRKVLLKHGNTPWVAAHTLVPETSLQHGLGQLTHLENKPLGELLFSTPGVEKDHLQACETDVGWGRRARYLLHQQPLLVTEFFLPDLIEHEHKRLTTLY